MILSRHHDDLERDRDERAGEEHREQRQVSREIRVGHPRCDSASCCVQERRAPGGHEGEGDERVGQMAAGVARLPRDEVVEAFRHPDLRQAVDGRVDQEQLLVGAKVRAAEQSSEHDRDRERHDESDRAACHQQERLAGRRRSLEAFPPSSFAGELRPACRLERGGVSREASGTGARSPAPSRPSKTRRDTTWRPACPSLAASSGSASSWWIARARAGESPGGTSMPLTPSWIASGVPPTRVATTGAAAAIDSSRTFGKRFIQRRHDRHGGARQQNRAHRSGVR